MIILHNEISGTNKFHEIKIYHNLPEAEFQTSGGS